MPEKGLRLGANSPSASPHHHFSVRMQASNKPNAGATNEKEREVCSCQSKLPFEAATLPTPPNDHYHLRTAPLRQCTYLTCSTTKPGRNHVFDKVCAPTSSLPFTRPSIHAAHSTYVFKVGCMPVCSLQHQPRHQQSMKRRTKQKCK